MTVLSSDCELVDAHVHLTFAAHGEDPEPPGSSAIQEHFLRMQAASGVTLVRDCGAVPGSAPPPAGAGLPVVISWGEMIAPAIPFLAHLRTRFPPRS